METLHFVSLGSFNKVALTGLSQNKRRKKGLSHTNPAKLYFFIYPKVGPGTMTYLCQFVLLGKTDLQLHQ